MVNQRSRLTVHPRCKKWIKGAEKGYRYARRQNVRSDLDGKLFADRPIKNDYSHPQDAGQHLLIGEGVYKELTGRSESDRRLYQGRAVWTPYDRTTGAAREPRLRNR